MTTVQEHKRRLLDQGQAKKRTRTSLDTPRQRLEGLLTLARTSRKPGVKSDA
jgi:hypothetical protein